MQVTISRPIKNSKGKQVFAPGDVAEVYDLKHWPVLLVLFKNERLPLHKDNTNELGDCTDPGGIGEFAKGGKLG